MTKKQAIKIINKHMCMGKYAPVRDPFDEYPDDTVYQAGYMAIEAIRDLPEGSCRDCRHWWADHELCGHEKSRDGNILCLEAEADFFCKRWEGKE